MSQPKANKPSTHHGHSNKRRRISPVHKSATDDTTSSSGSDSETEAYPAAQLKSMSRDDTNEGTSSSGSSDSDSDRDSEARTNQTSSPLHTINSDIPTTDKQLPPTTNIHNRLTSFFSQLAEQRANPDTAMDEIIEEGSSDSGYEDGEEEDGKQYVELDLALGVLSEEPGGEGGEEVRIHGREGGSEPDEDEEVGDADRGSGVLQTLRSIADGGNVKTTKTKKRKVEEVT
ncbi:hypothetical protein PMZ80_009299 [Knufia obscura]|uniref:Uncharacterized protein n=1 Tax=Knufia obscura TaxID=1635080 RepID=A0ABR0RDP0_9EURO|nr:hypothetical protein PMZ80_009299 [Knufia obscura]